jgi:predicted phosphodiesterase
VRIAVISDLHLGTRGATDLFGHDDSEFARFLGFLEKNFERIVLLGDVWETLTGVMPGSPLVQLEAARAAHPEIARRFARARYAYVHGNHDLIAAARGAPEELAVEADGVRLLFTHGHQNDFIVAHARWLSELGVFIGGWVRRLGFARVYDLLRKLDGIRSGFSPGGARPDFQHWAVDVARLRSADVVVTGHTHVAERAEHGDRLFLNSGSCALGQFSFLAIDTKAKTFSVERSW